MSPVSKRRAFFTVEMGEQLRQIRRAAGLSQAQVAIGLELKGRPGQSYVSRLEKGRISRPCLDVIVRYLHICGARMAAITDLLDRVEPLPEDASARALLDRAWTAPAKAPLSKDQSRVEEAKQRVIRKSEQDAAKFQRHATYPLQGVPPSSEKLAQETGKLRDYYYQCNLIRQDIRNYLSGTHVAGHNFIWYTRVGIKFLSVLRKFRPEARADKLAEVAAWAHEVGMEPEIISGVQTVVETRWQMTFRPEERPAQPGHEQLRRELGMTTAFLRFELYEQAYRLVLPLLTAEQQKRGVEYCELAVKFYEAWVETSIEPDAERASRLQHELATLEGQAVARGLVPAAVQAVREHCGRKLSV